MNVINLVEHLFRSLFILCDGAKSDDEFSRCDMKCTTLDVWRRWQTGDGHRFCHSVPSLLKANVVDFSRSVVSFASESGWVEDENFSDNFLLTAWKMLSHCSHVLPYVDSPIDLCVSFFVLFYMLVFTHTWQAMCSAVRLFRTTSRSPAVAIRVFHALIGPPISYRSALSMGEKYWNSCCLIRISFIVPLCKPFPFASTAATVDADTSGDSAPNIYRSIYARAFTPDCVAYTEKLKIKLLNRQNSWSVHAIAAAGEHRNRKATRRRSNELWIGAMDRNWMRPKLHSMVLLCGMINNWIIPFLPAHPSRWLEHRSLFEWKICAQFFMLQPIISKVFGPPTTAWWSCAAWACCMHVTLERSVKWLPFHSLFNALSVACYISPRTLCVLSVHVYCAWTLQRVTNRQENVCAREREREIERATM